MRGALALSVVLALFVAACGAEPAATTVAPTTEPKPEAVLLSYELEPGTTFRYEVEFQQHMVMTASGDPAAMGGEEEMPGNADFEISGVTTFTQTVDEGVEPGTFDVTIVGDFSDLSVTGTVDGEPVDSAEIPDFAEIEPVRTTVTVDEHGNVISTAEGSADPFGSLSGELGGMGMPAAGLDMGSLVGPSLPDRAVTVGDTWSETIENPLPFGDETFTTSVESRITGTDSIDGTEVFVIETTSSTSVMEIDLGEMMIAFFEGFMSEEANPNERAELEAMMEELRFLMTVDPSSFLGTTWFDPEAGFALRSEAEGTTHMTFDINFPDEATGEMIAFAMDMTMDQRLVFRFLDAGSA